MQQQSNKEIETTMEQYVGRIAKQAKVCEGEVKTQSARNGLTTQSAQENPARLGAGEEQTKGVHAGEGEGRHGLTGVSGLIPVPEISEQGRTRFFAKVQKGEPHECHPWIARRDAKGYGIFYANDESFRAHRVAWVIANGPIPDGLLVLHRCDNPSCVNPEHLFLGTNADNAADKVAKGRVSRQKGELCGTSKLTDQGVRSMRTMRKLGISIRDISLHFQVTKSAVKAVLYGKTWSHVT